MTAAAGAPVPPVTVGAPAPQQAPAPLQAPATGAPGGHPRGSVLTVPRVALRVDGAPVPDGVAAQVGAVRVRREASAPAACGIELVAGVAGDADAALRLLRVGSELEVEVGLGRGPERLFRGDVLTVEHRYGPDGRWALAVRCQDRSHRWRQGSRTRVLVDVTVGDVLREVAQEAGLGVALDVEGPRWPQVIQDGRSTLALVTALCRRAGLWWQVDVAGRQVRLLPAGGGPGGLDPVTVRYGGSLLEAVVTLSAVGAHEGWRVTGWDPVARDVLDEASGAGARPDGAGLPSGATPGVHAGVVAAGSDHAAAWATALTEDEAARARTIRAVVVGDARLAPGVVLTVEGLAGHASGDHRLLATDHVVDATGGWTCAVTSAPPPGMRPVGVGQDRDAVDGPVSATTPGEVVRVDDPDRRGRVRVSLTAYDGLESDWLPVLALGAGEDKGLTVQPDVGDRVLVLHDPLDPGRGVVLGGLRSGGGSEPAAGIAAGAVGAYALRLPGGQVLRLSAERDHVSVANAAGSRVDLDTDGVRVHASGDLVLEAPGRTLTLRAERIDLERG